MANNENGTFENGSSSRRDRVSQLLAMKKGMNKLSTAERLRLRDLQVQLIHKVLPQHEIESRAGSHAPTSLELQRFMQISPLKRGPYSSCEDEIITNNWSEFCKRHNWSERKFQPFLLFRYDNKSYIQHKSTRRKFVQFMADGLPNRTLYSVYFRFRTIFSNYTMRRYNTEEDELILNHLENNPNLDEKRKLSDLARVLNRTRQSIWRRYERLKRHRDPNLLRQS